MLGSVKVIVVVFYCDCSAQWFHVCGTRQAVLVLGALLCGSGCRNKMFVPWLVDSGHLVQLATFGVVVALDCSVSTSLFVLSLFARVKALVCCYMMVLSERKYILE